MATFDASAVADAAGISSARMVTCPTLFELLTGPVARISVLSPTTALV